MTVKLTFHQQRCRSIIRHALHMHIVYGSHFCYVETFLFQIVEGLSSLIATEAETINIIPPAPQIIPTEQNQQLLIEISQPKPTRPVPLKLEPPTIKIEIEEDEKSGEEISRDHDDLRQPSKMQQASSDESTDTASETDMYDGQSISPYSLATHKLT